MLRPPRLISAVLALFILVAMPAAAQSLDALRASGALGEKFDGLVVARQAGASAAASSINAERQRIYEKRAKEQGVSATAVGTVYAKEIYRGAPSGTWFLQQDGRWVQK